MPFTPRTRQEYHSNKWKTIFLEEDCPFCKPIDQSGHTVWKGKYWYILHNLYPYSGDNQHLMAVPYTHKVFIRELSPEEFLEILDIEKFMKEFYGDEDYFSATRETMANRSVEHLHIHFIPGKLQWKYLRKMLHDQGFPIDESI